MARPLGGPTSLGSTLTLLTLVGAYLADHLAVRRASGGVRRTGADDRHTFGWIVLWQVVALSIALAAPLLLPAANLPAWLWVPGLVVAWMGIGLRVWAVLTLGRHFSRVVAVEPGQEIVDDGPYRFVRHPAYTGILLVWAGIALAQANLVSLVAGIVVPLLGYIPRIRVEERALSSRLDGSYDQYAKSRARLVPGVW